MSSQKKNKRRSWSRFKRGLFGLLSISFVCYVVYSSLNASNTKIPQKPELKAAIVDHLSLTQPNQTFVQTATGMLEKAGFMVDYYKGGEVTVEFYRALPTFDYSVVIFRVHSTALLSSGTEYVETSVSFFTSEPVSNTKYIYDQLKDRLVRVFYLPNSDGDPSYFGITANFVRESMNGRFENTVIMVMGCDGLTNPEMAKAFLDRGAEVYIGWNGPVLASHTDCSTTSLLRRLLIEKKAIDEALMETFLEVGADPQYKSILIYYPMEAAGYTIQSTVSNPATSIAEIRTQNASRKAKQYPLQ